MSKFLSQPFSVADIFTGFAGKFVPLETAIGDFGGSPTATTATSPRPPSHGRRIDDAAEKANTL